MEKAYMQQALDYINQEEKKDYVLAHVECLTYQGPNGEGKEFSFLSDLEWDGLTQKKNIVRQYYMIVDCRDTGLVLKNSELDVLLSKHKSTQVTFKEPPRFVLLKHSTMYTPEDLKKRPVVEVIKEVVNGEFVGDGQFSILSVAEKESLFEVSDTLIQRTYYQFPFPSNIKKDVEAKFDDIAKLVYYKSVARLLVASCKRRKNRFRDLYPHINLPEIDDFEPAQLEALGIYMNQLEMKIFDPVNCASMHHLIGKKLIAGVLCTLYPYEFTTDERVGAQLMALTSNFVMTDFTISDTDLTGLPSDINSEQLQEILQIVIDNLGDKTPRFFRNALSVVKDNIKNGVTKVNNDNVNNFWFCKTCGLDNPLTEESCHSCNVSR